MVIIAFIWAARPAEPWHDGPMIDMRFPTALQMVLSLAVALETGQRCTSGELAAGLGANPSFVRKLLVPLNRDGIVASSLGKNGGVRLGRPADQITLRDVYRSITEDKRIMAARPDVPHLCFVSANMGRFFETLASEAEDAVLGVLSRRTIADGVAEMRRLSQQEPGPGHPASSDVQVAAGA